jgi:hypothetical protein
MLEFAGRKIPNELSEIVAPECTVLLVWDMQNDQAGGSFNKDALDKPRRDSKATLHDCRTSDLDL